MILKPPAPTLAKEGHPESEGCVLDCPFNLGFGDVVLDYCPNFIWDDRTPGDFFGSSGAFRPAWTSTPLGPGVELDGINFTGDEINFPDKTRFNFGTGAFSGEIILKRGGASSIIYIFASKDDIGTNGWFLLFNGINILVFGTRSGGVVDSTAITTAIPFNDPNYWYIFFSRDVLGNKILFAKSLTSSTEFVATSNDGSKDIDSVGFDVNLGHLGNFNHFPGIMVSFRLWKDRSFPEDEIRSILPNIWGRYYRGEPMPEIFAVPAGRLSRYHGLDGLGGQGQMTWNPLG